MVSGGFAPRHKSGVISRNSERRDTGMGRLRRFSKWFVAILVALAVAVVREPKPRGAEKSALDRLKRKSKSLLWQKMY